MPRSRRTRSPLIAVIPVRQGVLPSGGSETVAETDGRVLLIGSDVAMALDALDGTAADVALCEIGDYAPAAWSHVIADLVTSGQLDHVELFVLPASPDGRDLAPRLAARLACDMIPSAIRITTDHVDVISHGGRAVGERRVRVGERAVITFQPGARNVAPPVQGSKAEVVTIDVDPADVPDGMDPVCEELLPPDVSTMDLSEAPRLFGGGAGLDSAERFERLARVASLVDAAMGATRVITDKGWLGHDRQIGTTGVVVDPDLYIAFGISGAVQHTAGLGHPDHIISINTDEHAPMMEMADLAIVADANETLDHLEAILAEEPHDVDATGGIDRTGGIDAAHEETDGEPDHG